MSGRGGRGGCGGCGNGGHGGKGHGRGHNYTGASTTKAKGLCSALGNHVFEYGQRGAADTARVTWEKIVHHVGTIYGHDISNELQVILPEQEYTDDVKAKHQA